MHGAPKKPGFHSHSSPNGLELVIFDTKQILPIYVVHFKTENGSNMIEEDEIDEEEMEDEQDTTYPTYSTYHKPLMSLTQSCKIWNQTGYCPYGAGCWYASSHV